MKFSLVSLAASLAILGMVGVDAALPDKRPKIRGGNDGLRFLMPETDTTTDTVRTLDG